MGGPGAARHLHDEPPSQGDVPDTLVITSVRRTTRLGPVRAERVRQRR